MRLIEFLVGDGGAQGDTTAESNQPGRAMHCGQCFEKRGIVQANHAIDGRGTIALDDRRVGANSKREDRIRWRNSNHC